VKELITAFSSFTEHLEGVYAEPIRKKDVIMPDQPRPLSKENAPNPAHTYERTDPKRESGAGRLTNNANATPIDCPDKMAAAVHHAQDGSKQLNAEEAAASPPKATVEADESLGWEKKRKP